MTDNDAPENSHHAPLLGLGSSDGLGAAGINADCPMLSERRKGEPGRWRIGEDLVIRRGEGGGIQHCIGYFTVSQVAARKAWSDEVFKAVGVLFSKYRA